MDVNDPERNIDFRDMESVKEAIQNINGVYGLKHIDDATPR